MTPNILSVLYRVPVVTRSVIIEIHIIWYPLWLRQVPVPVIMVNCDLPRRLNLAKRTEFLARRAQAKPNGVFEKYQILVLKIMACRNLEIVLCSCTSEPIFLELPSANRH